ncbi:carbamoyltransferase [Pendulispora albinea]|uniref:Carbamoyltransferase n=1 Tax=Pendulispora albinea TaxID=2741071 RepID=A0ABZ2MBQ3_9BACT
MPVLGISGVAHDATVALAYESSGQGVTYAIEEERLSRIKNALVFPSSALTHVLETHELRLHDLQKIAFYADSRLDFGWMGKLVKYKNGHKSGDMLQLMASKHAAEFYIQQSFLFQLREYARVRNEQLPEVVCLPHHLTHAAAAYATSSFERAAILVADGLGGEACTTSYAAGPTGCERLGSIDLPHSLGLLYAAVTQHLGFKHTSDEWKVMGLAPYGESDRKLDRFFQELVLLRPDGSYAINSRYTQWHKNPFTFGSLFAESVAEHLGPARKPDEEITDRHRAVARALQHRVEEAMYHVLRHLHARTKIDSLCLVGGVALNCVVNGRILAETPFRQVYVPYAPGDAGAAVGAALIAAKKWPTSDFDPTPYLGPAYSNEQILNECRRAKLSPREMSDPYGETSRLIAKGDIVGWFQGRMEFGPRSLGHRSILADPRRAEMKDRINSAVKYREAFRPFAPAVLSERASDWFEDLVPSPYMSFALKVRKPNIPAVTHVDNTARLQTVDAKTSPTFHALISAFEKETSVPVVLNTSFNVKGEPIVCSPADAIRCFYSTGLDHLVMGPYLLSKETSKVAA